MATQNTPFRLDEFTRAALEYLAEEANTTMTNIVKTMIEREAVETISFTVYAPDLFLDWPDDTDDIDERESARVYGRQWERAVQAAYPHAKIDWSVEWQVGTAGATYGIRVNGWSANGGTGLVDMVAEDVAEIGGRVYQDYDWVVNSDHS